MSGRISCYPYFFKMTHLRLNKIFCSFSELFGGWWVCHWDLNGLSSIWWMVLHTTYICTFVVSYQATSMIVAMWLLETTSKWPFFAYWASISKTSIIQLQLQRFPIFLNYYIVSRSPDFWKCHHYNLKQQGLVCI